MNYSKIKNLNIFNKKCGASVYFMQNFAEKGYRA